MRGTERPLLQCHARSKAHIQLISTVTCRAERIIELCARRTPLGPAERYLARVGLAHDHIFNNHLICPRKHDYASFPPVSVSAGLARENTRMLPRSTQLSTSCGNGAPPVTLSIESMWSKKHCCTGRLVCCLPFAARSPSP
jgi:hypothetical protein